MSINFNSISPDVRASQVFIESEGVRRSVSGDVLQPITLIVGQYDQALVAGITDYVPVQVLSSDDVGNQAGFGFEAHRQALKIFGALGGFSDSVWWVPVPTPVGTEASGTIVFATNATSGGTYFFSIGGDLIQFNVALGDDPTAIGDLLAAAITAKQDLAVDAVNALGTVTLTAKNDGVNGNQIRLVQSPAGTSQSSQAPTGTTVTLPAAGGYLTAGAGNPDVEDVFFDASGDDILGDRFYTIITCPYNDATALGFYAASWDKRNDPAIRRPFDSFVGYVKDLYATALTTPASINNQGISPVWDPRSLAPNWELQAATAGQVMLSTTFDPGRPFKSLSTSLSFQSATGDLSYAKNDALFRAGMGYFKGETGELRIGDLAISYRTNDVAAPTTEWFDSVSIHRRQQKIYDMETLFKNAPYDRAMLTSDDAISTKPYVIKPKQVIADMSALVDAWALEGWTKNPATVKASISAAINGTNDSRIDTAVTDDEAQALRIVAVLYQFLF